MTHTGAAAQLSCKEITAGAGLTQLQRAASADGPWRRARADGRHRVPLLVDDLRSWLGGQHPHVDRFSLLGFRDAAGTLRGQVSMHTSAELDAQLRESGLIDPPGAAVGEILYFGAVDYQSAEDIAAIIDEVQQRARRMGAVGIFGPVSLLPNQTGAAVVGGTEHPGFFDSVWNDHALPDALEAAEFSPRLPAATWSVPISTIPEARRSRPEAAELAALGLRRAPVTRRSLRGKHGMVERMRQALNASFAPLAYYTQISRQQMRSQTAGMELLMDPRLVVAYEPAPAPETSSEPPAPVASFALVLPDPVEALRHSDGQLRLRDLPRLGAERLAPPSRRRGSMGDAVLIVQGTDPSWQGRGVLSLLSRELFAELYDAGYRRLRVTFIGEDNPASQAVFAQAGGQRLHRTAFFYKRLTVGSAVPEAPAQPAADAPLPIDAATVESWFDIASRAPSAHNTQPWQPAVIPALSGSAAADQPLCRGVELRVDAQRRLVHADPSNRDLYLALGAWMESLDIAAATHGAQVRIEQITGAAANARITLGWAPRTEQPAATVDDVLGRRVYRGDLISDDPLLTEVLEPFSDAAIFDDPGVAALERIASRQLIGSPEIVEELREWLRLDPEHPRHHLDGLSGECLLLPSVVQQAGRLLRTRLGRRSVGPAASVLRGFAALSSLQDARRLTASRRAQDGPDHCRHGTPVVLWGPAGSPAEVIAAGRRLQRLWLGLHRRGLCAAPATEMIDSPPVAAQLRDWLRGQTADPAAQPLAYFRVGAAADVPPRSARLTAR